MKRLFEIIEKRFKLLALSFGILILITFFDKALVAGIVVLTFLLTITYLVIKKTKIGNRKLFWLCVIVLVVHLSAVLFVYYFDFQPFSGGSGGYKNSHIIATELSENFREGNFSFDGVFQYENGRYPYRYYSVIVGIVYTVTMPEMIIGQLFQIWLSVLLAISVYLIVKEIGGSNKWAFGIGLISSVYPSYLFYSSLLLKDGLVALLAITGLLFCLKIIKRFSWINFFIFYLLLAGLFNFRFYIAYALLFTFLFCWFVFVKLGLKKKIIYTIIVIVLFGFLPEIIHGHGFLGKDIFKSQFSAETIAFYQEKAYSPPASSSTSSLTLTSHGTDSTWKREGYLRNFTYILLGPFPWQMTKPVHYLALFETIPWLILFLFVIRGIHQSIRQRNKLVVPLILFSLMILVVITIFINNFGIITRIRIPAFIALLCLIPLAFKKKNVALMKIYE